MSPIWGLRSYTSLIFIRASLQHHEKCWCLQDDVRGLCDDVRGLNYVLLTHMPLLYWFVLSAADFLVLLVVLLANRGPQSHTKTQYCTWTRISYLCSLSRWISSLMLLILLWSFFLLCSGGRWLQSAGPEPCNHTHTLWCHDDLAQVDTPDATCRYTWWDTDQLEWQLSNQKEA